MSEPLPIRYSHGMTVQEWIRKGREIGASDLHIAGATLTHAARELLGNDGWPQFLSRGSADVSRTISGVRCRINIFQTLRGVAMAVRLLSSFQNNLHA